MVIDPWASDKDAACEYGITLSSWEDAHGADCIIVAVAHQEFRRMSLEDLKKVFRCCDDSEKVLIDVKGIFNVSDLKKSKMNWWRL